MVETQKYVDSIILVLGPALAMTKRKRVAGGKKNKHSTYLSFYSSPEKNGGKLSVQTKKLGADHSGCSLEKEMKGYYTWGFPCNRNGGNGRNISFRKRRMFIGSILASLGKLHCSCANGGRNGVIKY